VWCQDVLELELAGQVDVVVSTAALHWVTDHERLWQRLARALRPAGILEVQCGGAGNIAGVREVIENVARDTAPELVGWSPWEFATPEDTERPAAPSRLRLDPMLAAGPADLPAERGAIRTNVDPGTPRAPPKGTT
jgi:SAM-dependent methyltransferase